MNVAAAVPPNYRERERQNSPFNRLHGTMASSLAVFWRMAVVLQLPARIKTKKTGTNIQYNLFLEKNAPVLFLFDKNTLNSIF
ncbi:MAG: hypothetical protein IJJ26_03560 [Victivallales bacterium]|nr:hypothetical protein [Victivallales bacterium]